MSPARAPASWADPNYVATVVGVLATGALVFYVTLFPSGLTLDDVVFVLLIVTLPMTIAYEVARRVG